MRSTTTFRALLVVLLVGTVSMAADGPPDPARVKELASLLPTSPRGVGYPIGDRTAWETAAASDLTSKLIEHAESLLSKPMPEVTDELFLEFSRNGNRSRCERVIFTRRARLTILVFAECVENQGRFLPTIEETIQAFAAEKTWTLPAHDRELTNFNETQITIDLFSSLTAWNLATADYWLGDKLSPTIRQLIRDELQRRIFATFEGMVNDDKPHQFWLRTTNNWNAVCLSNVTGAALTLIESADRRAWFVASAEKYLDNFLSGFTPDGYCSEGVGYWNFGFGHYVMLAKMLDEQTDGGIDLMAAPVVRQVAQFGHRMEITPGVYPAFADCSVRAQPAGWINSYVRRQYDFPWPPEPEPLATFRTRSLFLFGLFGFPEPADAGRAETDVALVRPLRHWFPDAGILICRPGPESQREFGAAMKGGNNAEHHNHNDVGSFVVALGDATPLVDPGSETYTRRTFSKHRYDSGVLNSWGHPVPRIGGTLQYNSPKAAARVLRTEFTDKTDALVLDMTAAYRVKSLKRLVRTFVFSREGSGNLRVTDEVEFDSPTTFDTALVTFDDWSQMDPKHLRIGKGVGAVDVEIETAGAPFAIQADEIHEDLHGHSLPTRLGIELTAPVQKAIITTTIRPAK